MRLIGGSIKYDKKIILIRQIHHNYDVSRQYVPTCLTLGYLTNNYHTTYVHMLTKNGLMQ